MEDVPDLSIVIVSYNTRELLLRCLDSIFADQNSLRLELYVVDNASKDGSAEEVSCRYPEVNLIRNTENVGFARANNQALRKARGKCILLLNSDTELKVGTLGALSQFMETHPEAGAIAPKLVYADGIAQPSVDFFPNLFTEFSHLFQLKRLLPTASLRKSVGGMTGRLLGRTVKTYLQAYDEASDPVEVDCASGGCLMVRREVIDKVGLLDENFFIFVEDMDWCIRMKQAGYKTYYLPQVTVVHHVGKSVLVDKRAQERAFVEHYRSRLYFFKKHRGILAQLILRTMMTLSFSLRWLLLIALTPSSKRRDEVRQRQRMYKEVIKVASFPSPPLMGGVRGG